MTWYAADEDGWPDFSRPLTSPEMLQDHWDTVQGYPQNLSDFYLNFHQFDTVCFMVFAQRVSAAILLASSARDTIARTLNDFRGQRREFVAETSDWQGEKLSDSDESIETIHMAQKFAYGSAIVVVVAALESLLYDLLDDPDLEHVGLGELFSSFFKRNGVTRSNQKDIKRTVREAMDMRNRFAHALTGPYFAEIDSNPHGAFDFDAFERTLFAVTGVAARLEELMTPEAGQER